MPRALRGPARRSVALPALHRPRRAPGIRPGADLGSRHAGEGITVTLGGDQARATAQAGADGKWTATFDLSHAGPGPYELVAESAGGRAVAADVLVGEVWLCSGQSNMEFQLKNALGGPEEAAASANSRLRQFLVTKNAVSAPTDAVQGKWEVAGPQTSGNFTAVGYYFGKKIQSATGQAVGLIHSSWGGTPVEAWTSQESFAASDDDLRAGAEKARANTAAYNKFVGDYKAWQARCGRQDHEHPDVAACTAPATEDGGWHAVTLLGTFAAAEGAGLPDAGSVWVQRRVTVKRGGGNYGVTVHSGDVRGGAEVYWNGKKIGGSDPAGTLGYFRANGPDVRSGENLLAVRIFQPDAGGGIAPGPGKFQVDTADGTVELAGA